MSGYMPSIIMLFFAWFFINFPAAAVALVVGGLLLGAFVYAVIYYKLSRVRTKGMDAMKGFEREVYEKGGPSFKNVTVTMVKTGKDSFGLD